MSMSKHNQVTLRSRKSTAISVKENYDMALYEKAAAELDAAARLALKRKMDRVNTRKPKGDYRPLPKNYYDILTIIRFPFKKGAIRTKTEKTCRAYEQRAKSKIGQFEAETSLSVSKNPVGYVLWMLMRKQLTATRTWRADKAAVRYYAEKNQLNIIDDVLCETDNHGGKDHGKKVSAKDKRTSAKKRKSINDADLKKIITQYDTLCDAYWPNKGYWMFFTIYHLGLRPIELTQTRYGKYLDDDGIPRLGVCIKNAKHSNGRGNGTYRTLFIDHFDRRIQEQIFRAIDSASVPRLKNGKLTTPENYVRLASAGFSAYMKKLFPRRETNITLYTARHQFAANAKKSGMSRRELACIMGHISDRTASFHYAPGCSGRHTQWFPKPLASQVNTVRRVHKPFTGIKSATKKGSSISTKLLKGPKH